MRTTAYHTGQNETHTGLFSFLAFLFFISFTIKAQESIRLVTWRQVKEALFNQR